MINLAFHDYHCVFYINTPGITIRVFFNDEEDASLCLSGANETIMEDIVL